MSDRESASVAASVKVRPVHVLVHRQDTRRATRADLAGRRTDQLGRVVDARLLLYAGAPRREGNGALRVVEVALHLVHPLAVVELRSVVDEIDAEHHAGPELGRSAEVRPRGRVDGRVGDDGRVHILLHRLVEHVLSVSPSDLLEAFPDDVAVELDELGLDVLPAVLLLVALWPIGEALRLADQMLHELGRLLEHRDARSRPALG